LKINTKILINRMKIGIYSPNLNKLNTSHKLLLTMAEFFLQKDFDVEMFWEEGETIALASNRFNIVLSKLKLNKEMFIGFSPDASYLQEIKNQLKMHKFDLVIYHSDYKIPRLSAKQNWLFFHKPQKIDSNTYSIQQKLTKIHQIITSSHQTKKTIDDSFLIKSTLVYPPVSTQNQALNKENIILNVNSFYNKSKNQDILISVFKKMIDNGLSNWKLILIGEVEENQEWLLKLREDAIGYPIEFFTNQSYKEIINFFKIASIYWFAQGYSSQEKFFTFPTNLIEAMNFSCIPIAFSQTQTKTIIEDKKNGYIWKDKDQLINISQNIIQNINKINHIKEKAKSSVQKFSKQNLFNKLEELL